MDKHVLFQHIVAFAASVHQMTNEMTKAVKLEAITPLQYKMLEYVWIYGPVTLSDISECMHMSMPNTSRELKKLSEKQLCVKDTDLTDKRKQFIRLSEAGQTMMKEAFERIEARFGERLVHLPEEELEDIGRALELLSRKVFY